jgi:HEAT repeat protein
VLLVIALTSAPARADRVDDLCRTLTSDPSWRVRLQAAVVLGKLHDARSVPSLVRALSDDNETVRGLSAQVLGEIGDGTAIAGLEHAHRSDGSALVRDKAGEALARLHPEAQPLRGSHAVASSSPPARKGTIHVEVGGIGMKTRTAAAPELVARLRAAI